MISSYNYLNFPPALFLLTYLTQGMDPFIDLSLSIIPFIYQGLSGIGNQEYLSWELKGTCY